MNSPRLSVIIPCYNQGKYIMDTLSCFDDYHQQDTYELIIVDDGSKDEKTLSGIFTVNMFKRNVFCVGLWCAVKNFIKLVRDYVVSDINEPEIFKGKVTDMPAHLHGPVGIVL